MADFDKVNIDSASYNVKDTKAREDLAAEIQNRTSADQTLQGDITAVSQALQVETSAREQADANLQNQITGNTNALSKIPPFNAYSKGSVLIVGDSFAGDWQGFSGGSWADRFIELLGNPTKYIYSFGGCGFVAGDNTNHRNFANNITQVVVPALQSVASDITLIVIQGGVNDGEQDIDAEQNNVLLALNNLKSAYPNAKILGLTNLSYQKMYETTMIGINQGFAKAGVANLALGNYYTLGASEFFASDNIHPNDDGHSYISTIALQLLMGGTMIPQRMGFFISDPSGSGGLICQIMGDRLEMHGSINVTETTQTHTIGTLPNQNLAPIRYTAIPVYADSGLAYLTIDTNGQVQLYSPQAIPSGFGNVRFNFSLLLCDRG